ncbi:MAG: RsmB/NOP family class I SAM-dependent RNA methyltransferase [Parvibaculaceae bacterium]
MREDGTRGLASRAEAARLLSRVFRQKQSFDTAFEESAADGALSSLEARDRALARAIVSTALRRLGEIESRLRALMAKPLPRKSGLAHEILVTAAAQMLFMRVAPHAAIDLAVRMARADRDGKHFAGLVNAVLRRLSEGEHETDARLNVPDWLWSRWATAYGATAARAIAESHLEEPPLDITVKKDAAGWREGLGGILLPTGTVRLEHPSGPVDALPGFADGAWWVQDAAAALPARLLDDVRGRQVLDLCAAPGGKTAQLLAAGAHVTALDRSRPRLRRLEQNLDRLGYEAETVEEDALTFDPPRRYDAVLLDAPCSATGTIRRHPDVAWLKREEDIAALADLQRRLLDHAAALVAPGGLLVYSTCSLEPEEGEGQAARFAERHSDFAKVPIREGEIGGLAGAVTQAGDLRTLPFLEIGESRGLDGFFATRFRRR